MGTWKGNTGKHRDTDRELHTWEKTHDSEQISMHNYTETCLHEHLNTTAREHTKSKTNIEGTLHIDIYTHPTQEKGPLLG